MPGVDVRVDGRRAWVWVLVAALSLASCDTSPGLAAVGVTRDARGRPVILYLPCPGEAIERVQVVIPVDNPGGGDDELLWEIRRSGRESTEGRFVLGVPPPGYTETVPFARPLDPRQLVVALVDTTTSVAGAVAFRPTELRTGMVISPGYREPLSLRAFREGAPCP